MDATPRRRSRRPVTVRSWSLLIVVLVASLVGSLFGPATARAADPPVAVGFNYINGTTVVSQTTWGTSTQIKSVGPCYRNQYLTVWIRVELGHGWRPYYNKLEDSTCVTVQLPQLPVGYYSYAVTRSATSPDPNAPLPASSLSAMKSLVVAPRAFTSAMYNVVDATVRPGMNINAGPESAGRTLRIQAIRSTGPVDLQLVKIPATGKVSVSIGEGVGVAGTYRIRAIMQLGPRSFGTSEIALKRVLGAEAVITNTTAAEVSSTYRAGCPVGPSGLSTITMYYRDYSGTIRRGLITVKRSMASVYAAAFDEAFRNGQRIQRMDSANLWGGDDIKIMAAGNTVAFNCRQVVGNPYALSPHSYGYAIDINQRENPYRDPQGKWYPVATYATNRPATVVGLHTASSPIVKALRARGFQWFSGWDWHHFEKP